jgi:hypothetical protein
VHIVDVVVVCAVVAVLLGIVSVLARQRFMLRAAGTIPLAIRSRSSRWQYGVGRYSGAELQWYRSLGLATRPSRVLDRSQLTVVSRRSPVDAELHSLPASAVIVQCRLGEGDAVLALGESAYTGFVSWLEASAPRH